MFQVKICGITSLEDAQAVVESGADAVGLNFYAHSPRFVEPETAAEILKTLPDGLTKVGLFVDTPAQEICRIFDELSLDLIQLHGDQPPEFLVDLGNRPIMRAFRVGPDALEPVIDYLVLCQDLGVTLQMVLLDAFVPGEYGGTGKVADWEIAKRYASFTNAPPLVLAGGLTPSNVAMAIQTVAPAAVDTASGVESQPGRKNAAAVKAFVAAARAAFNVLSAPTEKEGPPSARS